MRACDFLTESGTEQYQDDLAKILLACERGPWTAMESAGAVEVRASGMLASTLQDKPADIESRLREFISYKQANPTAAWGKSDTPFVSSGPLGQAIPKLRHAHLNRDVSVFYTIEGRDPTVLKIYGVFRHKESGTSTSSNIKIQKQLASQLKQVKI